MMRGEFSILGEEQTTIGNELSIDDIDLGEAEDVAEDKLQKKVARHLMPLVYILFFFAFLDRANLGNMRNSMNDDIPMSDSKFGFALGVFYISYVFFQLPANVVLEILKPKIWIAIIAFAWGLVTLLSVTISSSALLIVFRFLLGMAESGLAPALMLYIRLWFSNRYRARIMSIFMMAIPASNFASGLISAFIITHTNGALKLSGWQWLFIVEGVPTIILGFAVLYFLPNSPQDAKFLTSSELMIMHKHQKLDTEHQKHINIKSKEEIRKEVIFTLTSPRNWLLSIIGFLMMIASAGISGFLPAILYEFGTLSRQGSNLLSSLPNFIALFSLYLWSARSDRKGERFFHTTSALALSILGLALCCIFLYIGNLVLFVIAITIYSIGFWAGESIFVAHGVTSVVGSPAIGIALYNSVFTIGGWLGPHLMGILKDHYHNHLGGLMLCGAAIILAIAGLIVFRFFFEISQPVAFVEMSDISGEGIDDDDFMITDDDD